MLQLLFVFCFFASQKIHSQIPGCTDYRASNFNSAATQNDGSCLYAYTQVAPQFITFLDHTLAENSSLQIAGNALWSINDSYNKPTLYKIDSATGSIIKSVYVANASNADWEAMAATDSHLVIMDIGNNYGTRQNLCFYKVPIQQLSQDTVQATHHAIYYPQQSSFGSNANTHFDGEAAFVWDSILFHFTKQWDNYQTSVYHCNLYSTSQAALLIDSFNCNGLITSASLSPDKKSVAILGYNDTTGNSFLWLLWDFQGQNIFGGNRRRLDFGIAGGQCEGIEWENNTSLLMSNETVSPFNAALQRIVVKNFIGTTPTTLQSTAIKDEWQLHNGIFSFASGKKFDASIYSIAGAKIMEQRQVNAIAPQQLLKAGQYVLKINKAEAYLLVIP